MKSARLMKQMMPRAAKKKGLKFIALVHDLDSRRGLHGRAAVYSDTRVLPLFDAVICHNDEMKRCLAEMGIPEEKLTVLGAFDYLTDRGMPEHRAEDGITVAGNLSAEKCGYVSALLQQDGKLPIHLYGKGLEGQEIPPRAVMHGAFPPDELPGRLKGGFGLVWDGPVADTCSGPAGEYLRINHPHKASLYLAGGMPVLIWKGAAAAKWIVEEGTGILVSSLAEAERVAENVGAEKYEKMATAARRTGKALRRGAYLEKALAEAERIVQRH